MLARIFYILTMCSNIFVYTSELKEIKYLIAVARHSQDMPAAHSSSNVIIKNNIIMPKDK